VASLDRSGVVQRRVTRLRGDHWSEVDDVLAAEEPVEIRLLQERNGAIERQSIAITMRTPGFDFDLAVGFLYGESIITSREDILDVSYCTDEDEAQRLNIVNVTLRPGVTFDA